MALADFLNVFSTTFCASYKSDDLSANFTTAPAATPIGRVRCVNKLLPKLDNPAPNDCVFSPNFDIVKLVSSAFLVTEFNLFSTPLSFKSILPNILNNSTTYTLLSSMLL